MKTYSEKLKDPRWQRKRLEVLNRDNFTCRVCESTTKTLHVHHIRYFKGREPWEYKEFYLVTLCEGCHKAEEDEIKPKPKAREVIHYTDYQVPQEELNDPATQEELDEFFSSLNGLLDPKLNREVS